MDKRNAVDIQMDVEIVSFLQECGFSFTEADIIRPTSGVMQKVYEFLLQTFLGLAPEKYAQPSYEILRMIEFPELYTEALSLMIFCGYL